MKTFHSKEQFQQFMSQLQSTNATLDYFCDFKKICANVDAVEIKLNQLNYLIGKEDMPAAVAKLWAQNSACFDVLNLLLAVRDKNTAVIDDHNQLQPMKHYFTSADLVARFLRESGLEKLLQEKRIKNLVDYVFGVETGLDTNARKNRGGNIMENRIAQIFTAHHIPFEKQVESTKFEQLSVLGEDTKVFDFMVTTKAKRYVIEVNFYTKGGSKLNEVARAYKELSPVINSVDGFEFVWITDGIGWQAAKNKLEDAYYMIKNVYNLSDIERFIEHISNEL